MSLLNCLNSIVVIIDDEMKWTNNNKSLHIYSILSVNVIEKSHDFDNYTWTTSALAHTRTLQQQQQQQ